MRKKYQLYVVYTWTEDYDGRGGKTSPQMYHCFESRSDASAKTKAQELMEFLNKPFHGEVPSHKAEIEKLVRLEQKKEIVVL